MKKSNRWTKDVYKAMKVVLANETEDTILSDIGLSQGIRDLGIYCSKNIAREVRLMHKISNASVRVYEVFARDNKARKQ